MPLGLIPHPVRPGKIPDTYTPRGYSANNFSGKSLSAVFRRPGKTPRPTFFFFSEGAATRKHKNSFPLFQTCVPSATLSSPSPSGGSAPWFFDPGAAARTRN
jgi:hypothetical protein